MASRPTSSDSFESGFVSDETEDLADLLHASAHENVEFILFWSFDTLCTVLTFDRVLQALDSHKRIFTNAGELESYAYRILPVFGKVENVPNSMDHIEPSSESDCYLKILAILILIDKVGSIKQFIDEGVNDGDLPLKLPSIKDRKGKHDLEQQPKGGHRADKLFRHWKISELHAFNQCQFQVNVPFFDYRPEVNDYDLVPRTVLPFLVMDTAAMKGTGGSQPLPEPESVYGGGYGRVRRVLIEPSSHNFHKLNNTVCIFPFENHSVPDF